VREVVEEIAFQARGDQRVDKRSGVSQRLPIACLENVISNAERRAASAHEKTVVPRVTDVYASLPAVTGKIELEYEGELKGPDALPRDLVRAAIATVFDGYAAAAELAPVIGWFERGGTLSLDDGMAAKTFVDATRGIDGLDDLVTAVGEDPKAGVERR